MSARVYEVMGRKWIFRFSHRRYGSKVFTWVDAVDIETADEYSLGDPWERRPMVSELVSSLQWVLRAEGINATI